MDDPYADFEYKGAPVSRKKQFNGEKGGAHGNSIDFKEWYKSFRHGENQDQGNKVSKIQKLNTITNFVKRNKSMLSSYQNSPP